MSLTDDIGDVARDVAVTGRPTQSSSFIVFILLPQPCGHERPGASFVSRVQRRAPKTLSPHLWPDALDLRGEFTIALTHLDVARVALDVASGPVPTILLCTAGPVP